MDELPQFWNILCGEMSLVGWQVSGRNRVTDFDEIARLDIKYIENWSLWLDIKILLKTFHVILIGHGSY